MANAQTNTPPFDNIPSDAFFDLLTEEAKKPIPVPPPLPPASKAIAKPAPKAVAKPAAVSRPVIRDEMHDEAARIAALPDAERLTAALQYFDRFHPIEKATAAPAPVPAPAPVVASASSSSSVTSEPVKWGKGVGYGDAAIDENEQGVARRALLEAVPHNDAVVLRALHPMLQTAPNVDLCLRSEPLRQYLLHTTLQHDSLLELQRVPERFTALLDCLLAMRRHESASALFTADMCAAIGRVQRVAADYRATVVKNKDDADARLQSLCERVAELAAPTVTPPPRTKELTASTLEYCAVMEPHRFGHSAGLRLEHHHHRTQIKATETSQQSRSKLARLCVELPSLAVALPLHPSTSVFVRAHESRLDVLKALVIGPEGTPYENGCFVFDLYLPASYPSVPPLCQLRTTGGGTVRFNPNLYNCGKVCLSLLGTWNGTPWDPRQSTLLQLLVSIQSLILVPHPYFNEPGWEDSQDTPEGDAASKAYNDALLPHTLNFAIAAHLEPATADDTFADVIAAHCYLRRHAIAAQLDRWQRAASEQTRVAVQTAAARVRRHLLALESAPPALVCQHLQQHGGAAAVGGPVSKLLVSVFCPVSWGDTVLMSGSCLALGGLDADRAAPLSWTAGHHWTGAVEVPAGRLEVRFGVRRAGNAAVQWDAAGAVLLTARPGRDTVVSRCFLFANQTAGGPVPAASSANLLAGSA